LGREEVERCRRFSTEQRDILRGVFISDAEIGEVLARMSGTAEGAEAAGEEPDNRRREAAVAMRAELEARRQASLDQGVYLALPRLAGIFGLTRFEEQLILLCL